MSQQLSYSLEHNLSNTPPESSTAPFTMTESFSLSGCLPRTWLTPSITRSSIQAALRYRFLWFINRSHQTASPDIDWISPIRTPLAGLRTSLDGAIDRESSESRRWERSGFPSSTNSLTCLLMCCRDFKKPPSRGDMWLIAVASMVFIWRSFRGLHHK